MLFFKSPLHCLRKTSWFKKLTLSFINNPKFFNIGFPFKVALLPITHASIWCRTSKLEPEISYYFKEIIKKLDEYKIYGCFCDVGANIGFYTWLCLQQSKGRKIISFEPDPSNFKLLSLTKDNTIAKNITLRNRALSNKNGNTLFLQDQLTSATGMIKNGDKTWGEKYLGQKSNTIKIKREKLDDLDFSEQPPCLIKIDVEGHELEVLEGGENIILKHLPILLIESFKPVQNEVLLFLKKLGYFFWDTENHLPLNENTSNFLSWHENGPLDEKQLRSLFSQ